MALPHPLYSREVTCIWDANCCSNKETTPELFAGEVISLHFLHTQIVGVRRNGTGCSGRYDVGLSGMAVSLTGAARIWERRIRARALARLMQHGKPE